MLEAGTVHEKNTTNILVKNFYDFIVGAWIYFFVGFAFSYGGFGGNDFIGGDEGVGFALHDVDICEYAGFFFQFTFAATATTIVSGAAAERVSITAYFIYSLVITGFIYPVVVYWTWSGNPWLTIGRDGNGYTDFAGSGVVHMTGGACALVCAAMLGPRLRRKGADGQLIDLYPHSAPLVALGTFILIFGFFAFNAGSTLGIVDPTGATGAVAGLAATNTIMAAAGGGLITGLVGKFRTGHISLSITANGIIAGMVAICAGAGSVMPWAALIIGVVAGFVYLAWSVALVRFGIDDALDAVPVHLGAGWWGLAAQPLFAHRTGIFYDGSDADAWRRLGWNLAGSIVIFVWATGTSLVMFYVIDKLDMLRVDEETEMAGLDHKEHGHPAYDYAYTLKHSAHHDVDAKPTETQFPAKSTGAFATDSV
ncbi:uncharacterized protein MONBRDRAFT_27353 [Monosiga brevicollis MX1]|uniref:Ammonium transporter n=1 Tax=Monosiga brevicollis TaxID=81824 RepID=A9V516_MONBE|nr:uncharacterized protein MONBRDRAFT_27353 [Monosiga brevicollis MX1]EDQ87300.1 predicted protein [Monosiga brevicollis MX1]|eukprot:XP_001747913.1 hypothetical protein [Monosiga brevicollis MX1]